MNKVDKVEQMGSEGGDDDRVLDLRTRGKSFVAIAELVGLGRPSRANEAFNRALRRMPAAERSVLQGQEMVRLEALAAGVRANRDLAPDDIARRLRTIARLRSMLVDV
jgi:hypothetical protein